MPRKCLARCCSGKCLAHRASPRLELCLSQVGVPLANRSAEPPDVPVTNRSMCLSQVALRLPLRLSRNKI